MFFGKGFTAGQRRLFAAWWGTFLCRWQQSPHGADTAATGGRVGNSELCICIVHVQKGMVRFSRFSSGTKGGIARSRCKPGNFGLSGTDDRHLAAKTGTDAFVVQMSRTSLKFCPSPKKEAAGVARRCDCCGAWHRSFSCLFFYPSLVPFQGGNFTIPTDFTQGYASSLRMA